MLLLCDVGNTNTVLGVYEGNETIAYWRIGTDSKKTTDEYGMLLRQLFLANNIDITQVKDIAISSVVPPLNQTLEEVSQKYFAIKPLIIGPGVKTGMPIHFDDPKEVGADR